MVLVKIDSNVAEQSVHDSPQNPRYPRYARFPHIPDITVFPVIHKRMAQR